MCDVLSEGFCYYYSYVVSGLVMSLPPPRPAPGGYLLLHLEGTTLPGPLVTEAESRQQPQLSRTWVQIQPPALARHVTWANGLTSPSLTSFPPVTRLRQG